MITGFLLGVFYTFFAFFVGLLPVLVIPPQVLDAFNTVFGYINEFSFLFPVGTLLSVIAIALTYYVVIFLFDIGLWLIHLFRGR